MTYGIGPANSQSAFLPIEFDIPEEFERCRELISKRERLTSTIVNVKENGNYETREYLSGQQWFKAATSQQSNQPRYGFRLVADLVALNGGNIPAGVTTITLTNSTVPARPSGWVNTLPSYGGATATDGTRIFLNDPQVFVRYNDSTGVITITNNYGADLTQCYFAFNYLKT